MHMVEIPVDRADLRDQMIAMRTWLDERRYETSVFNAIKNWRHSSYCRINLAEEPEAFANRFGGLAVEFG
jgi:hypothetical protein